MTPVASYSRYQVRGMWHNDGRTCCDDAAEVVLEKRLCNVTTGLVPLATVFFKLRIFLAGGCFSENTKSTPNATTTNSIVFHEG